MKFGINILNYGPGATPESFGRWARFAEETGYHFVMISDHVTLTTDVQELFPAPFYDPFLALSWIASMTERIELGTTVAILPYRHPLNTARLAANLDQLSSGRFILGAGVGWAKEEFDVLNVPFHKRGALTDEYLEIIQGSWAADDFSYGGEFVSFENVQTGPRPVRRGGIPIWIGGSTDPAILRAARYGDGWHPYWFYLDWLRDEALPSLREISDALGKPTPALCPRLSLRVTDRPLAESDRIAGHGTLAQIRTDLEELQSLGATYVLLDTYAGNAHQSLHGDSDLALYQMLAEEVLDLEKATLR